MLPSGAARNSVRRSTRSWSRVLVCLSVPSVSPRRTRESRQEFGEVVGIMMAKGSSGHSFKVMDLG